jgi:uroporphyrin-III C-methyltransferase
MMVQEASCGEMVVRLKGGDPFIFGRGGEELAYLEAAGVPVRTINGITAGLAAATSLNVSLTHRDAAHGVLFMTGHSKPGDQAVDWQQIGNTCHGSKLTLVIYMGVSNVGFIAAGLMRGLPSATPVAVVQNASLLTQRHVACALKDLAEIFVREQLISPAIMIIGNVTAGLQAVSQADSNPLTRAA